MHLHDTLTPVTIPITAVLFGRLRDRAADPTAASTAAVARAAIQRGLANPHLPIDHCVQPDLRMRGRRVTVRLDAAAIRDAEDQARGHGCSLAHALRIALARGLGVQTATPQDIAAVVRAMR